MEMAINVVDSALFWLDQMWDICPHTCPSSHSSRAYGPERTQTIPWISFKKVLIFDSLPCA